jgi:hypothetical protein
MRVELVVDTCDLQRGEVLLARDLSWSVPLKPRADSGSLLDRRRSGTAA